jgi:hypothetical protein
MPIPHSSSKRTREQAFLPRADGAARLLRPRLAVAAFPRRAPRRGANAKVPAWSHAVAVHSLRALTRARSRRVTFQPRGTATRGAWI